MKKFAVLAILLAFVGYFVAAPYIVVHNIQDALQSGDQVKLEDNIDFPAVRENIKNQLNAEIQKKFGNSPELKDNPFASLATAIGAGMVDTMVDNFVTPAGLTNLMLGNTDPKQDAAAGRKPLDNASLGFDGLSRFRIDVPGKNNQHVLMYLNRNGLSWKLSRIILPVGDT